MSLRRVHLTWEAMLCCATQALSTERQEVMGLLLGQWKEEGGVKTEATVRHVVVMSRTDRRKDRVEVGYEQLAEAAELATALTKATGVETRVLGWFHSHPHITVLPSHVDIRTQAQYQQMDAGFLGLIVAVFQDDKKQQKGRLEVTAFQSVPAGSTTTTTAAMDVDEDCIHLDDDPLPAPPAGGGGGGGFVRKGIPISLVPSSSSSKEGGGEAPAADGPTTEAMRCVVSLQEVLLQEERFFYEAAARTNHKNNGATRGNVHALYNSAVYSKALASLMEESALPLVNTLESILLNLRAEKAHLAQSVQQLEAQLSPAQRQVLGEEEKGKMDVDASQPPAAAGAAAPSPYHACLLAASRPVLLRRAAKGVAMRRRVDGGGTANEKEAVTVRLTRDYPPAVGALGSWCLHVGEEATGQVTRIWTENGTPTVVCFAVLAPGQVDARAAAEVPLRFQGSEEDVAFWCRRIQPLVCPSTNLLEA